MRMKFDWLLNGKQFSPEAALQFLISLALEEAIRANSKYLIQLAVVATQRVEHPINSELRELGVTDASRISRGAHKRISKRLNKPSTSIQVCSWLSSNWGLKGKQLPKRLEGIDLDTHTNRLRSNWRERLSQIQEVKTADSVMSVYRVVSHSDVSPDHW